MTNPKMRPCPKCGETDALAVYSYGPWKHVECPKMRCNYLGPGEGSIRQAIKSHNEKRFEIASARKSQ